MRKLLILAMLLPSLLLVQCGSGSGGGGGGGGGGGYITQMQSTYHANPTTQIIVTG